MGRALGDGLIIRHLLSIHLSSKWSKPIHRWVTNVVGKPLGKSFGWHRIARINPSATGDATGCGATRFDDPTPIAATISMGGNL